MVYINEEKGIKSNVKYSSEKYAYPYQIVWVNITSLMKLKPMDSQVINSESIC